MTAFKWLFWLVITALGLTFLMRIDAPVNLAVGAWSLSLPFIIFAAIIIVVIMVFVFLDRSLNSFGYIKKWHKERQTRKARGLILQGFSYLAAHEKDKAVALSHQIHKLWHGDKQDPFLLVYQGRLAEAEGNLDAANAHYETLLKNKEAKLYAIRAQLGIAIKNDDEELVKRLTAQALKFAPHDLSLHDRRIKALAARGEYKKAHRSLKKLAKTNVMSPEAVSARQTQLYMDQSDEALAKGSPAEARKLVQKAYKIAQYAPAKKREIETYLDQGNQKAAHKALLDAWKKDPDVALIPLWEKVAPDIDQFAFYETMLKVNPTSPFTHMALVKAALNDNRAMEARAHLEALKRSAPESYAFAISQYRISDQLDHDKKEAQKWLERADRLKAQLGGEDQLPQLSLDHQDAELL